MHTSLKLSLVVALVIFAFIGGSIISHPSASSDSCANTVASTHMVTLIDGSASEPDISGRLCDKIMFMNDDAVSREIAFGPHEDHVPYDGIAEKVLNKGQSFTITLDKTGHFHWHDHLHDGVEGYFTVSQ